MTQQKHVKILKLLRLSSVTVNNVCRVQIQTRAKATPSNQGVADCKGWRNKYTGKKRQARKEMKALSFFFFFCRSPSCKYSVVQQMLNVWRYYTHSNVIVCFFFVKGIDLRSSFDIFFSASPLVSS